MLAPAAAGFNCPMCIGDLLKRVDLLDDGPYSASLDARYPSLEHDST